MIQPRDDKTPSFEILPLFRYQPLPAGDKERLGWVESIFVDHKLYFPSRTLFNDPFDCVVPSLLDTPGTVLKRFGEEFVDRQYPAATAAEKIAVISKLMSVEALEGIRQNLQSDVDRAGILSLSKVRDDILMWSHYADKHKGLCLEFDGSANCIFFGEAQPVEYGDYRPFPLDESSEKQMARIILTKSAHWKYEQEYRIIQPERACQLIDFPDALLTGAIFGYLMPENLKQMVKRWAAGGGCRVAFFEARPKTGQFALDITRVS